MYRDLLTKIKNILITLRFSILSIFVTLFVVAMLALIYINFHQSSNTLLYVANKLMRQVSDSVHREFSVEIQKAQNDSELSILLIEQNLIDPETKIDLINYTLDLAYQFYLVQAAYWGEETGSYIKAEYNTNETIMTEVIDRRMTPPQAEHIYRDVKLNIIKKEFFPVPNFDPRKRPWYIQAAEAKKAVWTDIYTYQPSGLLGVTLATPIYKKDGSLRGVFGVDIGLDWMSWYVSLQKISSHAIIFIATRDGRVIAHSKKYDPKKPFTILDINKLDTPWIGESFNRYKKHKKAVFDFSFQGKEYLATYQPIVEFAKYGWVIGIVAPEDDFTGELKKTSLINTIVSLVILIIGVLIVSTLVTRVVRPIKDLVKETNRIRNLQLSDGGRVKTIIKEVMVLSDAIYAMKMGLNSFKKYIPATLVRQLIETGQAARIGGTKKPLIILFSDIVDFTKIAEVMDPNHLMEHMCEYFDELSRIISQEKGTIDKYIGDSIMAFWGAPVKTDEPEKRAALAALRCERRLSELNKKWASQDKPLLITRFGIHLGEAVVGNVGSTERMNYTALGDAINVASRLEGVNKIYGTRIIISSVLYERIKEFFIVRKIDVISVKGKTKSDVIYELLAENRSELTFDIDLYNQIFEQAFAAYSIKQWDEAIILFKQCGKIYPHDPVAALFIKRCQVFKLNPPLSWDGVWRMGL